MTNPMSALFDFIDKRRVIRRVQVLMVMYMLWDVHRWSLHYAETAGRSGAELALVIAAVIVPATTLVGFIYRAYDSSRRGEAA